jgi:hypothetical protein
MLSRVRTIRKGRTTVHPWRWTLFDEDIDVERRGCDAPDVSCKSSDNGVRNQDVMKKPLA